MKRLTTRQLEEAIQIFVEKCPYPAHAICRRLGADAESRLVINTNPLRTLKPVDNLLRVDAEWMGNIDFVVAAMIAEQTKAIGYVTSQEKAVHLYITDRGEWAVMLDGEKGQLYLGKTISVTGHTRPLQFAQ